MKIYFMTDTPPSHDLDTEREKILASVENILSILWLSGLKNISLFRSAIHRSTGKVVKVDFFTFFHANMGIHDSEYERWYIIEWEGGSLFFSYEPTKFRGNFTFAYNLSELDPDIRTKILPVMGSIREIEEQRKLRIGIIDGSYEARVARAIEMSPTPPS